MAEHGTRTMYVHHRCRCDACCKAEHEYYRKRANAKGRIATRSKWGTDNYIPGLYRKETQKKCDANRYKAYTKDGKGYSKRIKWQNIADKYNMTCAICGCKVNPDDTYIGKNERKCYGPNYPTVDHIIPLKRGGTDTLDNVQLACKRCNSSKGAKLNDIKVR